ncbi:MAG: cation diffusion facilitator family transporter [Dehalococcoidia bacterium]
MSAGHHHHSGSVGRVRAAFFLNVAFTVVEVVGGILSGSIAILADAVHDLGDTVSLGAALVLEKRAQQRPNKRFSYGYRRLSAISALLTGTVLLVGSVFMIIASISRFSEPGQPHGWAMLGLAVFGVGVNGVASWYLSRGATANERILKWHLLEDVLGWCAVLVGSLLILVLDWTWIDPVLALAISGFVIWNVFRNLAKTMGLFLQEVPAGVDLERLEQSIESLDGVLDVHDLHVWSLDGEHHVLSCHTVAESATEPEALKRSIRERIGRHGRFHVTIELEFQGEACIENCSPESSTGDG